MLSKLKTTIQFHLNRPGFDIVRNRRTFRGALQHIKSRGLRPGTVIDVGVGRGTPELYEVFQTSELLLVEPLEEFEDHLERIRRDRDARVVRAAAASSEGEVELNVHGNLEGSSIYREAEGEHVDGTVRTVPAVTLDGVTADREPPAPYLLKVDVQGAELDVLDGATETLEKTEYVLLEASLFRFFRNGPVVVDVLEFMDARGFALYDVTKGDYRPLDGALAQLNLAFVKKEGRFRQTHHYATPEQREAIECG